MLQMRVHILALTFDLYSLLTVSMSKELVCVAGSGMRRAPVKTSPDRP